MPGSGWAGSRLPAAVCESSTGITGTSVTGTLITGITGLLQQYWHVLLLSTWNHVDAHAQTAEVRMRTWKHGNADRL